jgi:aminoglycoside 3-N-acetyltransferase I
MLDNPACIIVGVTAEGKTIGGLVAFEMTPIHGTKELYIYDIAIHPDFQKQGLGKKLIETIKEEARARGVGTIFVEAEREDEGAVAFYRAIGGEEVKVNHFNFTL